MDILISKIKKKKKLIPINANIYLNLILFGFKKNIFCMQTNNRTSNHIFKKQSYSSTIC